MSGNWRDEIYRANKPTDSELPEKLMEQAHFDQIGPHTRTLLIAAHDRIIQTPDLNQALQRLRWVRGRDYDPRLADDVKTVLAHFGLEPW